MRRQNDDGAGIREAAQPVRDRRHGAIIEAGKRLVKQEQPGRVHQRALEGEPLPHAARKRRDGIVCAIRKPGVLERAVDNSARFEAKKTGKERQILARRQFRIEMELVREEPDTAPDRSVIGPGDMLAVPDSAAGRRDQCREECNERGLAGAIWSQQADDVAGLCREREVRDGTAPPEVPGNIIEGYAIEVEAHAAIPARLAGSGLVSSGSRDA